MGKIDGEAFPGGSTEDAPILLGSGNFIPGFEEGLIGAKAGEEREVEATFPAEYPEARLAGKTARFEVKVKEVATPETPPLDEDFAKGLGVETVEALRDTVKKRLEQDRAGASRLKLKRALLDALNEGHSFELPPTLVDNEFKAIWHQVMSDLERTKRSFADEGTTEEKAKADYRDIAARRVRLGLDPLGGRHAQSDLGHGRRGEPRAARARQAVSGPGAQGLRLLPQQPRAPGRAPRADLRGQGDRLHPRARQDHREAGERWRSFTPTPTRTTTMHHGHDSSRPRP